VGALLALFIVVETDPALFPEVVGFCGLVPTLARNGVNLWESLGNFSDN
jgi:hypothetical protein